MDMARPRGGKCCYRRRPARLLRAGRYAERGAEVAGDCGAADEAAAGPIGRVMRRVGRFVVPRRIELDRVAFQDQLAIVVVRLALVVGDWLRRR